MRSRTLISLCLFAFPALTYGQTPPTLNCSTWVGLQETMVAFVLKDGAIQGYRASTSFGPFKCDFSDSPFGATCSGFEKAYGLNGEPVQGNLISVSIQKLSDVVKVATPNDGRIDFVDRRRAVKPLHYLASYSLVDTSSKTLRYASSLVCTEGEGF